MYPLAKFGGHRFYRKEDIISYMDILEKAELTTSICHIAKSLKSGIPICNFEVRDMAGRETRKKRESTGKFKAFCLLCKCKSKHQTSICNKLADSKSKLMLVTTKTNITYPIAILKLNGVKFRALLGRLR